MTPDADLCSRLRELADDQRELANDCDCPPEATVNWRHVQTCEDAIERLSGECRPMPATDPEGWCDWTMPIMESYRMQCCDCGLVHEMQFNICDHEGSLRVEFRMRRELPPPPTNKEDNTP